MCGHSSWEAGWVIAGLVLGLSAPGPLPHSLPTPVLSCGLGSATGPWMGPRSLLSLGGLGRQIQSTWAESARAVPAVSLASLPSPLSSVSRHLEAHTPVHVCCSHFSGGFICPHLHKKYHTPQLNEQAHLAVQASSRLRLARPGAVIISLFLSKTEEGAGSRHSPGTRALRSGPEPASWAASCLVCRSICVRCLGWPCLS